MNIEQLREVCLALPQATEDIKWEHDLCFCIGNKMFAVTGIDESPMTLTVKVADEHYDSMLLKNGVAPAKYLAKNRWITISNVDIFSEKELQHFIANSYALIKSKLTKKALRQLSNE